MLLRRLISDTQISRNLLLKVMAGVSLSTHSPPNRLANEKSPYLLQHADNPVDWYPWGQEAFDKAKAESKPVFLSVGYSTCHWCHVMERESFENDAIAKILNENFVSVKVDREERPDVDKVYMTFVQATQGGGGWPMSVFLTPDLKPIMGGTYFPPEDSYGRPGFATVLRTISEHWKSKKRSLEEQGSKIIELLSKSIESSSAESGLPGRGCIQRGYEMLEKRFDETYGGFGKAPKFPQPTILEFLLSIYGCYPNSAMGERALQMTLFTLRAMANGGMHDHVGQGFHRYSTDKFWHVPHFEKMLYDQGQLACIYAAAYQISKDEFFRIVLEDILLYVIRDLTDIDGGFYSAEDADSYPDKESKHKKEGAFCVWTKSEISSLLTSAISSEGNQTIADLFCYHYGIKDGGNVDPHQDPHNELTGKNVLIIRGSLEATAKHFGIDEARAAELLKESRELLLQRRLQRPKPHRDDKIVTSWNGLMISGLAQAYTVTKDCAYLEAAKKAATFVKSALYDGHKGTLLRNAYRDDKGELGKSTIEGFADDYAFMISGLLDLFEACQDVSWLEWACQLQEKMVELFWDHSKGGFFSTTTADPSILLRMKDDQDGAEPSANSCSAHNLQRLAGYFAGKERGPKSTDIYKVFSEMIGEHPIALPKMVSGFLLNSQTPQQIIIAGELGSPGTDALLDVVRSFYLPNKIIVVHKPGTKNILTENLEVLASITEVEGKATAYICKNYTCTAPITDLTELKRALNPKSQI